MIFFTQEILTREYRAESLLYIFAFGKQLPKSTPAKCYDVVSDW